VRGREVSPSRDAEVGAGVGARMKSYLPSGGRRARATRDIALRNRRSAVAAPRGARVCAAVSARRVAVHRGSMFSVGYLWRRERLIRRGGAVKEPVQGNGSSAAMVGGVAVPSVGVAWWQVRVACLYCPSGQCLWVLFCAHESANPREGAAVVAERHVVA